MRVLLPAPLGPAMPRISPDAGHEVDALEGARLAERLADAAELHDQAGCATASAPAPGAAEPPVGRRSSATVRPRVCASTSRVTAPMVTTPTKMSCAKAPTPMMAKPLRSTASSIAPISVPKTVPRPPDRLAPPMTTAANTGKVSGPPELGPTEPT